MNYLFSLVSVGTFTLSNKSEREGFCIDVCFINHKGITVHPVEQEETSFLTIFLTICSLLYTWALMVNIYFSIAINGTYNVLLIQWYYEFIFKCKCTYLVAPYEKCVWIDWDKFVQFKMPKWSQMLHSQNVPVFSKKGKVLYMNQIFIIHYVNW